MKLIYASAVCLLVAACSKKEEAAPTTSTVPVVSNGGASIRFANARSLGFLKTEPVARKGVTATITVPAKVSATVVSSTGAAHNLVLFENPDLASNYTSLIQHQININQIQNISIRQKQIELDRMKDLQAHGAATGKDLLDAQTGLSMEHTNLANEKAALIEHETKLKAAGFDPDALRNAGSGTAYITCDLPENQLNKITEGAACSIQFTAFPNEQFTGKIDDIADVVDNVTRMVKLRVTLKNTNNRLKAGMFALLSFGVNEGDVVSVPQTAIITAQGKNYVFVQTDSLAFERKPVTIGAQIGERVLVQDGLAPGSAVVVAGAIQLKGLSFGY